MAPIVHYLEEHSDFQVVSIAYPSTRASVADHAAALRAILAQLDEVTEINFVAHSMGNLVVRHYMADHASEHRGRGDPRIKRFVMLAPPNQGSRVAATLGGNILFDTTLGPSAQELGPALDRSRAAFGRAGMRVWNCRGRIGKRRRPQSRTLR